MQRSLLVALVVASVAVAGCIGGSGGGPSGSPTPDTGDAPDADGGSPADGETRTAALAFDADPIDRTVWANGSVPFHHTQPRAWFDDSERQVVPLDDHVPPGVPVRVNASVSWQEDPVNEMTFDNIDLHLEAPASAVPASDSNDDQAPRGSEYLAATISRSRDQSVALIVETQWATADSELEYTLRIDVTLDPTVAPKGAVVQAPTVADRPLTLVPSGDRVDAVAFGPDGTFLGHVDATGPTEVPGSGPVDGEVALAFAGSGTVRAPVPGDGSPASLAMIGTAETPGEAHAVPADGTPARWSFETDRPPVAVGLVVASRDPGSVHLGSVRGEIRGPDGTVVTLEARCTLCLYGAGSEVAAVWSDVAPAGGATSFEATVTADRVANVEVWHVVRTVER